MAKKQVVSYTYTCDVCGDSIPEDARDDATRKVSVDGTEFVLDVCSTHAGELDDVLASVKRFVDAGQRSGGRRGRRPAPAFAPRAPRRRPAEPVASSSATPAKRGDLGAIRAWAQENGHKVGDRGRIPAAVLAAYEAATSSPQPAPAPRRRGRPRKTAAV